MKKIVIAFILIFFATQNACFAMYFGTYKSESEYGLIDGFKFNFGKKKEGEKLIQLKSETREEIERLERDKDKPKEVQNEYEMFRFMRENTVPF